MLISPFYWLRRITSKCFFVGHERPIEMLTRSGLHFECPRCGEDFGEVLKGQTFKAVKWLARLRSLATAPHH